MVMVFNLMMFLSGIFTIFVSIEATRPIYFLVFLLFCIGSCQQAKDAVFPFIMVLLAIFWLKSAITAFYRQYYYATEVDGAVLVFVGFSTGVYVLNTVVSFEEKSFWKASSSIAGVLCLASIVAYLLVVKELPDLNMVRVGYFQLIKTWAFVCLLFGFVHNWCAFWGIDRGNNGQRSDGNGGALGLG